MGIARSKLHSVVMLGVGNSGKTTILNALKLGKVVEKEQTIGFNQEEICFNKVRYLLWDVGGSGKLRCLWRHYGSGKDYLIYVVDSADREKLGEATEAFYDIIDEKDFSKLPILVLANKQDLEGAMSTREIAEHMELSRIPEDRPVKVLGCSAVLQEGLTEGFQWFIDGTPLQIREQAFKTAKSARS